VEKQIVQARPNFVESLVALAGRSGFSQSGPSAAISGAFALLRRRSIPILASELLHAQPSFSYFVANSSIHFNQPHRIFDGTGTGREADRSSKRHPRF
jgi:hypothetical protein